MKKFFRLICLALAAAMLIAFVGCEAQNTNGDTDVTPTATTAPTQIEKIKAAGELRLGTEAQYAPYEFKTADGTIVGFDIELAQAIADELGVELVITDMAFDGLLAALQTDAIDIAIAGMTPDADRALQVDFSKIYYEATQSVVIRKADAELYKTIASLTGKQVGAQKGTIQETIVKEQMTASTLLALDKVPTLIMELIAGNIAGVVIETPVAAGYVKNNTDLMISEIVVEDEEGGSAVAVKKGSTELVDLINTVIDKVIADGSFDTWVFEANELSDSLTE